MNVTITREQSRWVVRKDGIRRGTFNTKAAARRWEQELRAAARAKEQEQRP